MSSHPDPLGFYAATNDSLDQLARHGSTAAIRQGARAELARRSPVLPPARDLAADLQAMTAALVRVTGQRDQLRAVCDALLRLVETSRFRQYDAELLALSDLAREAVALTQAQSIPTEIG